MPLHSKLSLRLAFDKSSGTDAAKINAFANGMPLTVAECIEAIVNGMPVHSKLSIRLAFDKSSGTDAAKINAFANGMPLTVADPQGPWGRSLSERNAGSFKIIPPIGLREQEGQFPSKLLLKTQYCTSGLTKL